MSAPQKTQSSPAPLQTVASKPAGDGLYGRYVTVCVHNLKLQHQAAPPPRGVAQCKYLYWATPPEIPCEQSLPALEVYSEELEKCRLSLEMHRWMDDAKLAYLVVPLRIRALG